MKKFKRDRLKQLLFFILFWEISFVLMAGFELVYIIHADALGYLNKFPANLASGLFIPNIVTGFFGGLVTGVFEVYLLRHKLERIKFVQRLFIKLSIYLPLIIILNISLGFFTAIFNNNVFVLQQSDWNELFSFITSYYFLLQFIITSLLIILCVAAFQIQYWFNMDHIANFWYGKYNRGRVEQRVILFMDMSDSTTIAEKLGSTVFFELLNDCFRHITESILKYDGKIIDYIGDEVVVSWPLKSADKLIEFFFGFENNYQLHKTTYINKYGVFPLFKGGGHAGTVTIGEIGTETKDIIYAGDLMNATSRIQGLCKNHNTNLLISKELKSHLQLSTEYIFQLLGEVTLKGKSFQSTVYKISYNDKSIPTV